MLLSRDGRDAAIRVAGIGQLLNMFRIQPVSVQCNTYLCVPALFNGACKDARTGDIFLTSMADATDIVSFIFRLDNLLQPLEHLQAGTFLK